MSGSVTPNSQHADSSLSLRTRKNEKELDPTEKSREKGEPYKSHYSGDNKKTSEIIEMGEVERWIPNLKEKNKQRWTLSNLSQKSFLVFVLFLFLFFGFVTKRTLDDTKEKKFKRKDDLYFNGTVYYDSTLIFISLDGFRNDYLERKVTPNIDLLGQQGIHAEYMNPSFPSITFPNHWTLATGLYPEAHGIVSNEFYDPVLKEEFIHKIASISGQSKWWGGEPIWITSKRQGKKSAVIMWPGSDVKINGMSPDYHIPYTRTTTAQNKMDIALNWLDMPIDQRPQSISIYIPQIDQKGHGGGPDGKQLNSVLTDMDNAIGHLIEGLKQRNLDSHVHIVLVSDHGMAAFDKSKLIFYDDIISPESESYLHSREAWPLLGLRPREDAPEYILDQIYSEIEEYTRSHPNPRFQFYRREEIPTRFHYNSTERIAPIVMIPDVGHAIVRSTDKKLPPNGIHGYDNLALEMRAIFAARGPKVQQNYESGALLKPFFNIEVYKFLTTLLNLESAPNNSTLNGNFESK